MEKYLYLAIDFFSLLFPLLFSFYPKANFSAKWKFVWPAILIPALLFIAWDEWFTQMGVWGFNPRYLSGTYFLHLPLEEILFFVCIPYACLFTYEAVNFFIQKEFMTGNGKRITWVLIAGLSLTGFQNYDRWYTAVTCFANVVFLLFLVTWLKPAFLGRFYLVFIFILIPFFIVNGILTGTGLPEPVDRKSVV